MAQKVGQYDVFPKEDWSTLFKQVLYVYPINMRANPTHTVDLVTNSQG